MNTSTNIAFEAGWARENVHGYSLALEHLKDLAIVALRAGRTEAAKAHVEAHDFFIARLNEMESAIELEGEDPLVDVERIDPDADVLHDVEPGEEHEEHEKVQPVPVRPLAPGHFIGSFHND